MEKLRRSLKIVDNFTKWSAFCVAPLCLSLIAITMYDVIGRRIGLFTAPAFDIEWFHYGFIMMLAMGFAVLKDQHVRIDLLTDRYSPRVQAMLMVFGYAVLVIPFLILVAGSSLEFSLRSMAVHELTMTAWQAEVWFVKLSIFAGICLMLPQCFAELIRHSYFAIKKEEL